MQGEGSKEKGVFSMADFAITIAGKISEYLVAPIGRQLGYLVQFSGNVETLRNELEKLGNSKVTVQQEVELATKNLENILNNVENWLDSVSSVEGEVQIIFDDKARFPNGCFNNWCLNLKSRYVLSRKAKKRTRDIIELQQQGKFPKVSLPAAPKLFMGSTSTTSDSRESRLKEIIENLKDENISIIGICGMGGVGKTTMVEEVLKRVEKEKMFDEYAKTVVSQKADEAKVQNDIAEMLSLKLEGNNPVVRASRLNQRLEGKKVLIILDDVWKEFDLRTLGITLQDGQRRCKIVYTSRTRDLWKMEYCKRISELPLDPLLDNESWNLFKEKIGDFLDDNPDILPTAKQIVEKCAGLPLALVTLACALLKKDKHVWKDTLRKLKTILGVEQTVYKSIRLSFDHLDDDEAKSLFLLCSLFEEDSRIYVESLVDMGMGLRLFTGINNVDAVRDRVFALVDHLQSRCLVSKWEAFITVHDVVRDVSKSIASTEKGSLVLEHGVTFQTPQKQSFAEHCTWISVMSNEIEELPSMSQFPRLELLRWCNENIKISDSCFEGLVKLQVVDIFYRLHPVTKLPSSLQSLTSLHTLCLRTYRLEDFTAINFLHSLEILRIADECIEELPKEIAQLTKLRLLHMSDCKELKKISPGIISDLSNLEELYLGRLEIDWGAEENEEGRNAAHREFESLSNLHILHIVIKDPNFVPVFKNLMKYQIQIGDVDSEFSQISEKYERTLSVRHAILGKDSNFLLHSSEVLLLEGESTKSVVCELVREPFQNIKYLEIRDTEAPEYLADATDCTKEPFLVSTLDSLSLVRVKNLQQIINGPLVAENFAKIKKLDVDGCYMLRNIFQLSKEVNVLHLEELVVTDCKSMEEVFGWERKEEEANRKLQFPKLKKLQIDNTPLICVSKGANEIEFHQLETLSLISLPAAECLVSISDENPLKSIFPPKVFFPRLVKMKLHSMPNLKEIFCGQPQSGYFNNLTEMEIYECPSLQYIFQLSKEVNVLHLEELVVTDCKSMEEVFGWERKEEEANRKLHFPKLKKLHIDNTPLVCFSKGANEIEFHQLETLSLGSLPAVECLISISDENPLKSIFPPKVFFPRLVNMKLHFMPNMKEIFCGQPQAGYFNNLTEMEIYECPSLQYVFTHCTARYMVNLRSLYIINCKNLKDVVSAKKEDEEILCGQPQAGYLNNLTEMGIIGCDSLQYVFTYCTARYVVNLRGLFIKDCKNLKDVVSAKKEDDEILCGQPQDGYFNNLTDMGIYECPSLQYVFTHCTARYMVNLRVLEIENCNDLKDVVSAKKEDEEILCGQPQAGYFNNLTEMVISGCDSLQYVFTHCTARYMVNLRSLEIGECNIIKEVVSAKNEDEEYTNSNILPNLKTVKLFSLLSLETFCHIDEELEFPMLEEVNIVQCPELKTFANGFVHTKKLKNVKGDLKLKGDLNSTIQQFYEDEREQRRQLEIEDASATGSVSR